MPQLAAISVGQRVIEHPISVQLHADFFATIRGLIEEFLAFGKTTVTTLLVNSRRTCENLARNIPWYVSSPHIGRLKNAMAGKPAIVVSAGPSLRKNKHLLKAASENAVIVSVQTTFQQLIDLGVEPDFVTSLDYHDISTQFFRNIPPGVRTELVAEPKASPEVFKLHPGPLSLLGNDFIEKLLAEMSLNHPQLTAGATVAHLAFYLAEHLGCNPIIFVGQDLGFADGLAYAPGTAYDDLWRTQTGRFETVEMLQWQRIVRDRAILRRVPDYQGKPTYTEERLYTYLQQFERDFLKSDRTIIDASEGGVAKRGARSMKLCDALEEFCRQPIERKVIAASAPSAARLEEAAECLGKRCEEAERVQQVSRDTLPLLAAMRDNLSDQSQVNQLIGQIDTLRTAMNGLGRVYQLITQLSQRSELDRYAADRRISASGLSGMERQRRQIERDMSNVEHLIAAADDFQSVVSAARQLCLARAAEAEAA
jgi:hypothetical protein